MKLSRLLITTVALSSLVTPIQGALAAQNTVTNENNSTSQSAISNSTSSVVSGVTSSNERNVQTSSSSSQAIVNSSVVQSTSSSTVEEQKVQAGPEKVTEVTWQDTTVKGIVQVNPYNIKVYDANGKTTGRQVKPNTLWSTGMKHVNNSNKAVYYQVSKTEFLSAQDVVFKDTNANINLNEGTVTNISGSITVNYKPGYGIYVRKGHDSSTSAVKRIMHGSQWKVFKKWTDGHQTWYNLGGDQWVKSDYAIYSKSGQVADGTITNINGSITVNYTPGYGIYVRKGHDSSTGAVKRIMHGSQWKVFKKWTDGHQTWYNLGGDQWVKSDYARYSEQGQEVVGTTTNINGSITVNYTPGYGIYIRKGHDSSTSAVKRIMHGSQWKVFKKWTDGHQTWYNLGGDQWVKSDYAIYSKPGQNNIGEVTDISGSVQIKYVPGYSINVYRGYGSHATYLKQIKHGTIWKVYQKYTDGKQIWYNLGGDQWIQGGYTQFTDGYIAYQNPAGYHHIFTSQIKQSQNPGYRLYNGVEGIKVYKVRQFFGLSNVHTIYDGTVTSRVRNWQAKHGIKATGIVDYNTWVKMGFNASDWTAIDSYVAPLRTNTNSTRSQHIEAMISEARRYMGKTWISGASSMPAYGVDCSGLVLQALYASGIDLDPISNIQHAQPGNEWNSRLMFRDKQIPHINYNNRQRGDLIFFTDPSNGIIWHVGILINKDQMIESWPFSVQIHSIYSGRGNIAGVGRVFR